MLDAGDTSVRIAIQDSNPLELPVYWIINIHTNFSKFQLAISAILR